MIKKSPTFLFLKRNYKINCYYLVNVLRYSYISITQGKNWGLFKTPIGSKKKKKQKWKHVLRVKNTRCSTNTQQNSNWAKSKRPLQDIMKPVLIFFFIQVVCKDFCFVLKLWNTPAHSVSWEGYFGHCWTFFYSRIYTSLHPAGQYFLKPLEHENATLLPELFNPWRHRSHFLLLPKYWFQSRLSASTFIMIMHFCHFQYFMGILVRHRKRKRVLDGYNTIWEFPTTAFSKLCALE